MTHSRSYFGRNMVCFISFGDLKGGGGAQPALDLPLYRTGRIFRRIILKKISFKIIKNVCSL